MTTVDTAAPTRAAHQEGLAHGRGIPFGRLLSVELRKMVDTRASRWLLGIILVLVLAVVILIEVFTDHGEPFRDLFTYASAPVSLLLPVVGILAMTAEWTQRTALVTFTLEPRRARVVAAKTLGVLLLGVAVLVASAVIAAVVTAIGAPLRGTHDAWQVQPVHLALVALSVLLGLIQGTAFGLVFGNSALAIVLYYVLPMLTSMLNMWEKARDVLAWVDLGRTTSPLSRGDVTATEWQQLGVSSLIWIALPFVVGLWVTLRREAK